MKVIRANTSEAEIKEINKLRSAYGLPLYDENLVKKVDTKKCKTLLEAETSNPPLRNISNHVVCFGDSSKLSVWDLCSEIIYSSKQAIKYNKKGINNEF